MEELCNSALLGFGMVTIHTTATDDPPHNFDFHMYNPRTPPKAAVSSMAKKMQVSCLSDEHYMKATVSQAAITNISKLPKEYSPSDYAIIPYVEFKPATTVFFLTGGTRKEASKETFQSMRPSTKKPKAAQVVDAKKSSVRSAPLFKVANWVVQLYDHGVCIHCLCFHLLTLLNYPLNYDLEKLLKLGSNIKPLRRRNTLLLFLARNPDLVNTPQTPQEAYRQFWMDSLDHEKTAVKAFIATIPSQRPLEAALCSSELIGLTKFAIETCEMLSMSEITNIDWLSKGNVGMEVCIISITGFSKFIQAFI